MFSLASGIYQSYFVPQQLNILLIGEEGTGKTTLLERIKATQTSRRVPSTKARAILACPAPKKYSPTLSQEEDVVEAEGSSRSLEDIPLNTNNETPEQQQDEQEYNVKPGARMLPLEKIRPTIGMNLAKVDLCGISCRIWDVGGKMHDLWERYYDDADAVIYCISRQHQTAEILEETRLNISDDVPFLIFFHEMTTTREEKVTCDDLLPHYHNNMMTLMEGSAKSGKGVREALEWLIPLARRQQQLRQVPIHSPSTK